MPYIKDYPVVIGFRSNRQDNFTRLLNTLPNKDARYIFPLVPFVALISVFWIDFFKNKVFKNLFSIFIILFSVLTFYTISFGTVLIPKEISFKLFNARIVVYAQHGYIVGPPQKENWRQEDLIKQVSSKKARLFFTGLDSIWFNNWGISYYSRLYKVPLINYQEIQRGDFVSIRRESLKDIENVQKSLKINGELKDVQNYSLPDGTILQLFEVR